MKINSIPGEFGFRALYSMGHAWALSSAYFFSYEDARQCYGSGFTVKWPVEVNEMGAVYVPDERELC